MGIALPCSIMSSYLGFGVSLKDSYADLASKKRRAISNVALTGLVAVPPLILALLYAGAFLHTLDIAALLAVDCLSESFPALIV